MKIKKILCTISVAAIATSVFCGCKANKTAENLVWYFPITEQADQAAVFSNISDSVKEKLGKGLDMRAIDMGAYQERMNMIIASGEAFDLCFTSNWTNKFQPNVYKKAYYPLTDILKEVPKLTDSLPDFAWNSTKINGDIYAVPNYQIMYYDPAFAVPTKLYEKYKDLLQNINTPKDIEPYLEALKKNNEVPYPYKTMNTAMWYKFEEITGAQMHVNKGETSPFCLYESREYQEYINLMSEWYNKGYIRSDISGNVDETSDVSAGKYGIWGVQYKPGLTQKDLEGNPMDITYIHMHQPYISGAAGQSALTAISRASTDPVAALKVIEIFNTDKDVYNLVCHGIEGTHYTKKGENLIEITDKENSKYNPNADWVFGNQFNSFYTDEKNMGIWEETDKNNREAERGKLYGFVFDTKNVTNEIANITSVISEYSYLEKGVPEIGTKYNEFMDKLSKSGKDKVLSEVKAQIEEFFTAE